MGFPSECLFKSLSIAGDSSRWSLIFRCLGEVELCLWRGVGRAGGGLRRRLAGSAPYDDKGESKGDPEEIVEGNPVKNLENIFRTPLQTEWK